MDFLANGTFTIGTNYWASHAGTRMWDDWQPHVVDNDFKHLSESGIKTLRVFPLWSAFQPITALYACYGEVNEYSFGDDPLPATTVGKAGMSHKALNYFGELCGLADKYGIKLVVGLLTGWMSGRLHVPPALEGINVLTDPRAIIWEVRFVRCFVDEFKNEPSIVAWDLGNECNCMAQVITAEEAYTWTSQIVGAILSKDNSRPIVSGMHSLLPDGLWTMQHQGELTDILTTHPYPYFTPHCDIDPLNSIRTQLHAVAETVFYRGIGGKPCFAEEIGTLGPMFGDADVAADFIRTNLFTLWSHDARGLFWWCANEQSHLTHPPYTWNAIERELGLFRQDFSKKPVLKVLSDFNQFLNEFHEKYRLLPPRIVDGVCILTKGQDTWGAAYMSFILAKQAGLELEFSYIDRIIPDADLYMIPSISSDNAFTSSYIIRIMEKVEQGATLYLSLDGGVLSQFEDYFGMKVIERRRVDRVVLTTLGDVTVPINTGVKYKMVSANAEVLAVDDRMDPVFSVLDYGKGKVFLMANPLEKTLLDIPDAFGSVEEGSQSTHFHFYRHVAGCVPIKKVAGIENPNIGMTEHIINEQKRLLILVNYDPRPAYAGLILDEGWSTGEILYGNLNIKNNDAAVIEVIKNK